MNAVARATTTVSASALRRGLGSKRFNPLAAAPKAVASKKAFSVQANSSKSDGPPLYAEGELDSRDRELSIIAGLSLIGWGLSKMAALRSGATGAFFRMNVLPMAGATLLSFRDRFCAPRWAQALLTVTYSVVGFWAPLSRGATALASATGTNMPFEKKMIGFAAAPKGKNRVYQA